MYVTLIQHACVFFDSFMAVPVETFLRAEPDTQLNRFYFQHITIDIFVKAFYLSKTESMGADHISKRTWELSLPAILLYILDIMNYSLEMDYFPRT